MTTVTESLEGILVRELTTLRMEIEAYPSDAELWHLLPGIGNSGGTLALHLCGNLEHFIGSVLGGSGYVRNRDAEFGVRGKSREELAAEVGRTIEAIQHTLPRLSAERLQQQYELPVAGMRLSTGDFLLHLVSHFGYHLGQLDYHRRIVTGGSALAGTLSPTRLRSARPDTTQ